LRYKLGVPISYEDVRWIKAEDLIEVGRLSSVDRSKLKNLERRVPAPASLQFNFLVNSLARTPVASHRDILFSALTEHSRRKNPGEFMLVELQDQESFSIVPGKVGETGGTTRAPLSPLDARISLPEQEVAGADAIFEILKAISAATGDRIGVLNELPLGRVRLVAKNEVARDVLARTLRDSYEWKAYWNLYFGADEGVWGLNLGALYRETGERTPAGLPLIEPVRWPSRPSAP
jgi:hypothetical protein